MDLVDAFYNKIRDYNFASMSENIANAIVLSYIPKACTMFESCNQDLSDRDDDTEFICVPQMLRTRLSTSDFHSLNLHNQLSKVMELRNSLKSENDQLAINKSYKNSKLFDLVTNRKKV